MIIRTPLTMHDKLIRKSDQIFQKSHLVDIKSVFPFDFFPDRLLVNQRQVSVIKMVFWASYYSTTIPIENIQQVTVETNPFFGSLIISEKWAPTKRIKINYLKKNEAYDAKKIIQELMVMYQNAQSRVHFPSS